MKLESRIQEKAYELGFAACGIVEAGDAIGGEAFKAWLDAGYAGEMHFLHRQAPLREHPRHITEHVKTIIATAARYPTAGEPGVGFYELAKTDDYHDVIRTKLRQLATWIHEQTPLQTARACVDSAPLPEREWAIRAGLGWQGRQSQLIIPGAGACTVLGFLLIDITLEPTPHAPMPGCGSCQRCVSSCPTAAILPNNQIDSRRCLSYLTLEHPGNIDSSLHADMDQCLFGCDICTAVCPWTQSAKTPVMPELANRRPTPDANELLEMDEATFKTTFKSTTVKRSGLERLQRNARITTTNEKNKQPTDHDQHQG